MLPLPLRLLLVEDREDDEILISRAFSKAGFLPRCERVQTAAALAAALRARSDWAVLLCDGVPRLDVEYVVRIARGARPALPIVIVSGRQDPAWRSAIERVADAFISKDRLDDVPAAVKGLLSSRGGSVGVRLHGSAASALQLMGARPRPR